MWGRLSSGGLENPRPVLNSVHAADVMSRCAVVDADGDPAHTMTLVSLMEEEYEKNTPSAEGLVDYRAAGLLVSGCKPGKEQLEQQVQSSYQEKLNEDFLSTAPDSGKGRVYMKRLCSLALAVALLATM